MSEYTTPLHLMQLLEIERSLHLVTKQKLQKAEHDRDRYRRRIKFLDSRHEILCREYRAVSTINRVLANTVQTLERRLLDESAAAQSAKEETSRSASV